jgi:NADH:ubiquinone oxidoreductase subunit D
VVHFFQCKSEPEIWMCINGDFHKHFDVDIWMRSNGDLYEYVAVYVDDISIAMKDLKEFVDILENVHHFKSKGNRAYQLPLGYVVLA